MYVCISTVFLCVVIVNQHIGDWSLFFRRDLYSQCEDSHYGMTINHLHIVLLLVYYMDNHYGFHIVFHIMTHSIPYTVIVYYTYICIIF